MNQETEPWILACTLPPPDLAWELSFVLSGPQFPYLHKEIRRVYTFSCC